MDVNYSPIYEHLFEYIGTQFPPPSSVLYGKMCSITLFFSNGYIRYDATFYALDIDRQFTFFFTSLRVDIFVGSYRVSARLGSKKWIIH